ncbi:hypothetical protein FLL45_02175 [Aliikangiella marina]|uniref:Exonuclease domain-containing protein n=1 Tax=Aliikangiella marina TaxID=1712262 RepID=A0A545THV7_9GAMM|nr:exonuclease domain-containing protein [Aliikangiella marina]TQV76785.1 hypothetical protein FLL45_02175 [Aliikangiella marina]
MSWFNHHNWFGLSSQRFNFDREKCLLDPRVVESYLAASKIGRTQNLVSTKIVAVDFETTGLDSKHDKIISMGFCPIVDFKIKLADCFHIVVKPDQSLQSDNVTIHGLTDDQVNTGVPAKRALELFLEKTYGAVILAHYQKIERSFIQQLAKRIIGSPLPLHFLDTLEIAHKIKTRRNELITAGSLRLFNLRKEYGLPNYTAHNALEDALATAELLFALLADLGLSKESAKLADLNLKYCKD